MRESVLLFHNAMRWAILVAALWTIIQAWHGYFSRRAWSQSDLFAGLTFTTLLNLQFMLGLMVYLRSPLIQPMFQAFGYATSALPITFFALLHPLAMITSVTSAQIVYSMAKRVPGDANKLRWAAWGYTLVTAMILTAIPWPFLSYGRPLIPRSMRSLQQQHFPDQSET
jgi:hypothetical protein